MHLRKHFLPFLPILFGWFLCSSASAQEGLAKAYQGKFLIGTALNGFQIRETKPAETALIAAQFNAITPENVMKSAVIHPEPDRYDFGLADDYVAFGEKHGMFVVGHTLVWHSQLSPFVQKMQDADSIRQFMKEHINTVVGRYKGRVKGWDVVNEALEEDGSLRKSIFLEKLGEDYILEAFRLAHAADPDAELYYNDYNIEQPAKRAGALAIVKKIQAAGLRIDGVGIQGHWRANHVPYEEIENSIREFSALGVKVMFTELDLGVLPNPWDGDAADVNQTAVYNEKMNPYAKGLPDSVATNQADAYARLFSLFLKYSDNVSRVTFWGAHDGQSWLNGWPIRGRTNYPLLFDRNLQPKKAYDRLLKLTKK